MGQISSSIGLISGINTAEVIDQLLAIEARPKQLVEQRNVQLTTQQVAFQSISAKLLAMKLSAGTFATNNIFGSTTAVSSDASVLTASSTNTAVPGSYSFTVDRLVSTQQVITGGFADQDTTPIAASGGTLTFEFGDAALGTDSVLSQLNAGAGIQRGQIKITDQLGNSALVDLSKALTVNDVLEAVNTATGINVAASVEGDAFKLVDQSGGAGTLAVTDVGASGTTASLGLNVVAVGSTLTGTKVNVLGRATGLSALNDRNGVRIRSGVEDLQVTRRDGTTFNVNLDQAVDLGGVIDAITTASGGNVTASVNGDGTGLQLVDSTGSTLTNLQVTALNGSHAAEDLGILSAVGADTLVGGRLVASLNSRLIKNINGGTGVSTLGTIDITNRAGNTLVGLDLSSAQSVSDVIGLINNAGHQVTASLNQAGTGILLTDTTGSIASDLIVADNLGTTASDLGLAGSVSADTIDSGNLQLRYISEATRLDALNGGLGVASGRFTITDSDGATAIVDLTQGNEVTIQDVLAEINSRGLAVNAQINDHGDGILIQDTGGGTVALQVEEAGSTTARDLGILGQADSPGDDLDGSFEKSIKIASVQTLLGTTALDTLNGGEGVGVETGLVDLKITDRDGADHNVNLDGLSTIDSVINAINTATGGAVTAAINTTATGLTLTDNTAGSGTFAVEAANSSSAAADLGILGSDDNGDGVINGTTLIQVTTLNDLVNQINDEGINVSATIVNDGSVTNPFRLSLQSTVAGGGGRFIFDDGGLGFDASTLVQANDAVVFFGSPDPAKAIAITSATNTLASVIPGATIDLSGTSDNPVEVTVARDDTAIVDAARQFVDDFNDLVSTLDDVDSFNAETEERGVLLGDPTVATIRNSLFRLVNLRSNEVTSQFTTLAQVGLTVRSGARLSFDETKFRSALQSDPNAVQQLFALKETQTDTETGQVTVTSGGILVRIEELLTRLTDSQTGTVQRRVNALDSQIELGNQRIEQLDLQLENKRARLEFQFLAMERALAQLQSQNSALAGFQPALNLATSSGGGSSSPGLFG